MEKGNSDHKKRAFVVQESERWGVDSASFEVWSAITLNGISEPKYYHLSKCSDFRYVSFFTT